MRTILLILFLAVLSSCASPATVMVNPTNGQIFQCAYTGWGGLGSLSAINGHHNCVESMKQAGWVTAEEWQKQQHANAK